MIDVSIIIVNYNTKKLTSQCISSIYKHTRDILFEIIVIDNNSTDGSVTYIRNHYPDVIIINNNTNLGFGKANNKGLSQSQGKYIFYLNSDTILLNNAVKLFFDYFESFGIKDKIGAIGTQLLNTDGIYIHSYGEIKSITKKNYELFRCFLGTTKNTFLYIFGKKLAAFSINHIQDKHTGIVPYITGADLFLRNNKFAYFDPRYFMYNEEVDLQLTMHKAGLVSKIIDGPSIIHLEGGSTQKLSKEVFYLSSTGSIQLFISYVKFYKKNFNNPIFLWIMKFLICIIWLNPLLYKKTKPFLRYLLHI